MVHATHNRLSYARALNPIRSIALYISNSAASVTVQNSGTDLESECALDGK